MDATSLTLSVIVREGEALSARQGYAEPELTLPIECSASGQPFKMILGEEEMKFVYSSIGRVLAGKFSPRE